MDSKYDEHLTPEFITFTETLDKLREESTQKILPELTPLWEQSK